MFPDLVFNPAVQQGTEEKCEWSFVSRRGSAYFAPPAPKYK